MLICSDYVLCYGLRDYRQTSNEYWCFTIENLPFLALDNASDMMSPEVGNFEYQNNLVPRVYRQRCHTQDDGQSSQYCHRVSFKRK